MKESASKNKHVMNPFTQKVELQSVDNKELKKNQK